MKNNVERCVILRKGDIIEKDDIRLFAKNRRHNKINFEIPEGGISLEEVEKSLILKALEKTNGNQTQAAKLLKIPRHVLIYRLEKYKI